MSRYQGRLPTTYQEAEEALRDRFKRTLLMNTSAALEEQGEITIQYHDSDIAWFFPDGAREFSTAGGKTVAIRDRLNAMLTYDDVRFVRKHDRSYVAVTEADGTVNYHPGITVAFAPGGTIEDISNEW